MLALCLTYHLTSGGGSRGESTHLMAYTVKLGRSHITDCSSLAKLINEKWHGEVAWITVQSSMRYGASQDLKKIQDSFGRFIIEWW